MRDYSPMLAEAVYNFLESEEWHFNFDKEKGAFNFALGLDGRLSKVDYYVYVHRYQLISYAVCPLNVDVNDSEQLMRMSEFLHRANYGLANGNFELDVRDGEIRYKSFVDWDGCTTPPSAKVIRNSIIVPAMMFNRYSAGIIRILFNGASAADVIDEIEHPRRFYRNPDGSEARDDAASFDPLASLLRDKDMDPQVRAMLERMARDDESADNTNGPADDTQEHTQDNADTDTNPQGGDATEPEDERTDDAHNEPDGDAGEGLKS